MQDFLKEAGYHVGEWQYYGYFAQETIDSISLFQIDRGLDITGEFDYKTLREFYVLIKDSKVSSYDNQVIYAFNNINTIGE